MDDPLEDFYTTIEDEADEMTYSDEGFDKIAVNFVEIEASCSRCHTTFPSKSKLHNHLKSGCLDTPSPSFPAQAALSIPIIASKAVHQSFGSGLVFRG